LPDIVEVTGQEFAGKCQCQRLAEIKLFLIRYRDVFIAVVDIVGHYVEIVAELGLIIELARLLAQKGLMLAPATGGDEFEGFMEVL
jgi:hypothetical protein